MIKNGRPYTIEKGYNGYYEYIDDSLITERPLNEIIKIIDWVEKKLTPDAWDSEFTSSDLKWEAQIDLNINFLHNEIKDAILFAGYYPINPDEEDWRYLARLRSINDDNPNEFMKWLRITHGLGANFYDDDYFEEAAHELLFEIQTAKKYLPIKAEKGTMIKYLDDIDARDSSKDYFDFLWEEYKNYQKKFLI